MGTCGLILGLIVMRKVTTHQKNPITITMVLCSAWYCLMICSEGIFWLIRERIYAKSFIILIKLTWYGVCILMSCDFLVATLYLKNALSLYTDKYSSFLNKVLFSTWIIFPMILVICLIIDLVYTTNFFR